MRPCEAEADLSRVREVVEGLGTAVVVVEDWKAPLSLNDAVCRRDILLCQRYEVDVVAVSPVCL